MPSRGAVDGDALAAVCYHAPAEHCLLDYANRLMQTEPELVQPEAASGLEIHLAYLHVHTKRAGS